MLSPFPFVPTSFSSRLATVAVGAPHDALLYLFEYLRPATVRRDEKRDSVFTTSLTCDVVELKQNDISLSAVNAVLGFQPLVKTQTVLLSSIVLPFESPVLTVGVAVDSTVARLAVVLKAVGFSSIPAELSVLFTYFTSRTYFQVRLR